MDFVYGGLGTGCKRCGATFEQPVYLLRHLEVCKGGREMMSGRNNLIGRHDMVVYTFIKLFKSIGYMAIPAECKELDDTNKRVDLQVFDFPLPGQQTHFDVAITNVRSIPPQDTNHNQ